MSNNPKKAKSVWEMLRNQGNQVTCPACQAKVVKTQLDRHLDTECTSSRQKTSPSSERISEEITAAEKPADSVEIVFENITYPPKPNKNDRPSRWAPNVYSVKRKRPNGRNSTPISEPVSDGTTDEPNKESLDEPSPDSLNLNDYTDIVFEGGTEFPDSEKPSNENSNNYSPYYIANFKEILTTVLQDPHNKHLFNEDDLNYVRTFNTLSENAQKLYVRLFQRKYKWLRPSKIVYPQIANDLTNYLEELVDKGLLDSGKEHIDLETALDLLSLAETKSVSKQFNLNPSSKSKSEISELLIKHGKQHKSFFSRNGDSSVTLAILKKVKQIVGPCYRLSLDPKRLFTRILMLFSLPTISEDDEEAAGGQQQQLFTLLQVKKGEVKFPNYKVTRKFVIFPDRDELIRYEMARQLENDIINAIESKKFDLAKEHYIKAREEFTTFSKTDDVAESDAAVPFFLRRYTARHVYVRCLNQGVEILQRLRLYKEAVELLRELLNQSVYCQDRRGKWYDRLALNLEQHLKQPEEAADAIKNGLRDNYVRVGPRFSLLTRAERIANSKSCNDDELKKCCEEMASVIEAPKVTVHGRLLPRPIPGRRHIFISSHLDPSKGEDDVTVVSVEQLAIDHYKTVGYTEGIHGEGSTFISLYALLFWDIIYDGSVPDVFISPYQTHPLDLNSDDFYQARKDAITSHLQVIRSATEEDLKEIIQSTWDTCFGTSSLVNWESIGDVERAKGLACCLGNEILAGICERLAKDFRFTRSGVPDLVVWNPDTNKVKIVEVKGPGDKLSSKQILWLDYLLRLGADAEVCLVEAVGSKKLKKR